MGTPSIEQFREDCQGAMNVYLIHPSMRDAIMVACAQGDVTAESVVSSIEMWLQDSDIQHKCSLCSVEFETPAAFLVLLPFARADGDTMTSGVCEECVLANDVDERIRSMLQKLLPGIQIANQEAQLQ